MPIFSADYASDPAVRRRVMSALWALMTPAVAYLYVEVEEAAVVEEVEVEEVEEVEAAVVEVDAKIVLVPVRFRVEPGGNLRTWRS